MGVPEELYDKKVKCPVCSVDFTSKKVKISKLRAEKRHSDLFVQYKGENPVKYSVYICPVCGYSALGEKYDKVSDDVLTILRDKITSKWKEREYGGYRSVDEAITCYKLALYCGEVLSYKKLYLGGICLRIAWLYRLKDDNENEQKFLKFTHDLYNSAYSNESMNDSTMDEITLLYLIGEISRRIGNKNEAVSWFSQVISHPLIENNPNIKKLAREQWGSVRDK